MSIKRNILHMLPIPHLPGWELRTVLLEFPPGYAVPPHTHPVIGAGYVVEGKLVSRYEGQVEEEYSEGDTFIDQAEIMHHRAENGSPDKWLRVVISYVVQKGQDTTVIA